MNREKLMQLLQRSTDIMGVTPAGKKVGDFLHGVGIKAAEKFPSSFTADNHNVEISPIRDEQPIISSLMQLDAGVVQVTTNDDKQLVQEAEPALTPAELTPEKVTAARGRLTAAFARKNDLEQEAVAAVSGNENSRD